MTSPFDDDNGVFHVLVNERGQHSLWPASVRTPDGWTAVLTSSSREECIDHIERNWLDLRPLRNPPPDPEEASQTVR
jgi:MbtH protein